MRKKNDIRSLSLDELTFFFLKNKYPAYRAKQVYEWLWKKSCYSFNEMTNISIELRELLKNEFVINNIKVDKFQKSKDGTIKNAIKLYDNLIVESVLIPSENRITACVSSQVGCSLDCEFCATSKMDRIRNLNSDEIYDQVVAINSQSLNFHGRPLSNIVFMGMGEPLLNYSNILDGIEKITSDQGLGMSPKRITVSTSGISKMIKKMADDNVKFNLAISLHSAIESTRNKIMPFTKKFPLQELKDAVSYWYDKTKKIITYEYIVWKGINDDDEHLDALIKFCKISPSKVNIIEYNKTDNSIYNSASRDNINKYIKKLEKNKIPVTVRKSRGKDIDAACGQLANKIK
ncbi:MAG: 23S rRNA (adenine(2503)-C(2))-methyltransferase RlmN [Flavobacteriaceae bacterium]|nr:23S rRNA (adenine(2503)-C(2))-methyltransferase RlmN [Flavobacteriaceae bacterium]